MKLSETAEFKRLNDSENRSADWKNWGPYVSERAWGTIREHYDTEKSVWSSFPFAHAHKRAYRWNEDGIAGFCNRMQNVCTTVGFWNGKDLILKERFFGVSGVQGNHGEDVKEYYYYLDGTPTHSYMKMLYKYPQVEYPYRELVDGNARRNRQQTEVELVDLLRDALTASKYFDIYIEYAKLAEDDYVCRVTAHNRSTETERLDILANVFFRNTWSWGYQKGKPQLSASGKDARHIRLVDRHLGNMIFEVYGDEGFQQLLFTENETNEQLLSMTHDGSGFYKDGINSFVVGGNPNAVNSDLKGTKAAAHFSFEIEGGSSRSVAFRLAPGHEQTPVDIDSLFEKRIQEANSFYDALLNTKADTEDRAIQRQALAGILWSKQFYHYSVELWLDGDPEESTLGRVFRSGRNSEWRHLYNVDVLSMPDKWEYPWFAAWDLAFHMIPTALLDPEWAKRQIILLMREWYMHPNGQIPAYEWSFSDVNPPVHAWAALNVFRICWRQTGSPDYTFLERAFHKLLLNFTWWVNRKDRNGNNVFEGGFLGLDNIGVFDRSKPLPTGGYLEQADGTAWMAMFSLNMLSIALELAKNNPAYEDVATKFLEHFVYIAHAINNPKSTASLWDAEDMFYYDSLVMPDGRITRMRTRSFVGLIPMFATKIVRADTLKSLRRFRRRLDWFVKYRPQLFAEGIATASDTGDILLSLVGKDKLHGILSHLLDEEKFLSPHGLRSLSREHLDDPYIFTVGYEQFKIQYEPAESTTGLFGGNSNWRGPVWFPINYLMLQSLRKFAEFWGPDADVEFPTGSGKKQSLSEVADDISVRLSNIFKRQEDGARPFNGGEDLFQTDPLWNDHILFYEYFHGDNGAGLGAAHQTGWTALVASLLQDQAAPKS
ncbi:MAG: glucosidase [Rhodothermales bacterium]|nr:glucosidase [Rhodothermales bacterium]